MNSADVSESMKFFLFGVTLLLFLTVASAKPVKEPVEAVNPDDEEAMKAFKRGAPFGAARNEKDEDMKREKRLKKDYLDVHIKAT